MSEETEKVGSVSQSRYEQIVAELRDVVEQQTQGQFTIGDRAPEIEPMRARGGVITVEPEWAVRESLGRLADDIGLKFNQVKNARWVASRWPKEHRRAGESWTVHRILASIEDEAERFATILTPPGGKTRRTADDASRRMGNQVDNPVSPQEKITAIHSLAREPEVAAAVTTDLLKRPQVADKVPHGDKVRVVEELTRDESVAATAATGLLRTARPALRNPHHLGRHHPHDQASGPNRPDEVARGGPADPSARLPTREEAAPQTVTDFADDNHQHRTRRTARETRRLVEQHPQA
ncbi:hypothetical protein SUDANB15_07464 (plasmid) [Streptomyces sp. enrichment culture]|uniref:DUF6192 family protein n=1 Tax=Streptomyces sp. enrichment culture TaxID=1795815 RepID=UPI003F576DE8